MLSCCAAELDPSLRVVIAEEVFECDLPLPNVAHMQTRPARADRAEVDLRRLVAGFLRMAPDVAIVGEIREREALALLLTLSSGVKGYTTIHAGSARQALTRLRFICQLARDGGAGLPMWTMSCLVSEAVDVVVHCRRTPTGVQVDEVVAVEDLQAGAESGAFTVTELFDRREAGGPLRWSGSLPVRAGAAIEAAGHDLLSLFDSARGGRRTHPRVAAGDPGGPGRTEPSGALRRPLHRVDLDRAATWTRPRPGGQSGPLTQSARHAGSAWREGPLSGPPEWGAPT